MTLADYRTNLTKEVISEVRQHFGDKVYKTIIPRTVKLTESPGFGKPIALYDSTSIGAQKYEAVACEMLNKAVPTQHTANKEVTSNMEEDHGQEAG